MDALCLGAEGAPAADMGLRELARGRRAETTVSEASGYSGHPVPGSGPSDHGRHVISAQRTRSLSIVSYVFTVPDVGDQVVDGKQPSVEPRRRASGAVAHDGSRPAPVRLHRAEGVSETTCGP